MPRRRKAAHRVRSARVRIYRSIIRDAAERLFAEHGFAGTGIAQIAREADVSIGTLYRVFPGRKGEIYRAIQEHRGTALLGNTHAIGVEAFQRRGDVIDAILAAVVAMVDFFAAHPDYLRIILREENSWAVGPERSSTEQTAMWRQGLTGTVTGMRHGIAAGLLVDDDPEAMARSWLAIQQAHLAYWLREGSRMRPADVAARMQRQFVRAFCKPEVASTRGLLEQPSQAPDKQ